MSNKSTPKKFPATAYVIDSSAVLRWGTWALQCSFTSAVYIIPADTWNELRLAASDSKCEDRTDEESAAIDAMSFLRDAVLKNQAIADVDMVGLRDHWIDATTGDIFMFASENTIEAIDFAETNCGKVWMQAMGVFGDNDAAAKASKEYHELVARHPYAMPINRSFASMTLESRPGWTGWIAGSILGRKELADEKTFKRFSRANFGIKDAPANYVYVDHTRDVSDTMRRHVEHYLKNRQIRVLSLGVFDQSECNVTPEIIKGLSIYRQRGFARVNRAIVCLEPDQIRHIIMDKDMRERTFNHDVRCVIIKDCETLSYPQLVDVINHMQDVPATLVLLYHNDPSKTQAITELNRVYAPQKKFAVVQY